MAELESRLSLTADSLGTEGSKPITTVSTVSSGDASGTNPLPHIYNTNQTNSALASKRIGPADLPSKKMQFSQWHELRRTEIKGSQLKAPRVRYGPPDNQRDFYELIDDDNEKIHHDLHGRQRKNHRNDLEDWEHASLASFTRQELHHGYQKSNLGRILDRLKKVVYLNLQDNELLSLSSHSFPRCEYINLDNNYLTSLQQLPKLPRVKHLTIQDNDISTLDGLSSLQSSPVEELSVIGNPVAFKIGYRYLVFSTLPHLRMLDGVVKQEQDLVAPDNIQNDIKGSGCVVS